MWSAPRVVPVLGVSNVARFIAGVFGKLPGLRLVEVRTGDGTALMMTDGSRVRGVLNLRVQAGAVTDVWLQVNPDKLRTWSITPPAT